MTNDENADENASPLIFETRVVQDGYSYWRSKFNEGRLPSRSDINPIDIPRLMPHAVMVDVKREPEYDFRYRLIGTYVAEHLFTDHTGSWFSEIDHQKAPSQIWQNCKHVCQRRSKTRPVGRSKTRPLSVMRYAVLRVVPVVHRRDPRCFA